MFGIDVKNERTSGFFNGRHDIFGIGFHTGGPRPRATHTDILPMFYVYKFYA